MGLLARLTRLGRRWRTHLRSDDPHDGTSALRICRFEEMEERQLMTADSPAAAAVPQVTTPGATPQPLHVGVVWWDPACGCYGPNAPSDVQISFEGGAAGTQLNQVVIDGSKLDGSLQPDDILFDSVGGGGPGTKSPVTIVSDTGFQVGSITENAASTQLIINLTGFTVGDVLELHINTDRVLAVNSSSGAVTMNAVVDGADFQGSRFTASFTAPHYNDISLGNTFFNDYDANFAAADQASGTTLDLPPQHWTTAEDESTWTAGAVAINQQVPLPGTISGTVFEDTNQDLAQESGEPGVAGVTLQLLQWNGTAYVATSQSTVTDASGNYSFTGLLPGEYQVVETPPSGLFAEGSIPGSDSGSPDGRAASTTVINEITLLGGDSAVHNNFALVQPVTLSGYVYHDANDDGQREPGEAGIAGVQLSIVPIATLAGTTATTQTVTTAADGSYSVSGLPPGTYSIIEVTQPPGYLDGLARAGTLGGTAVNPGDKIVNVKLTSGQSSQENDFGKLLPGQISGFVGLDTADNQQNNTSDPPLAGVQVQLLDAGGNVLATTTTNSQGQYQFTNLALGNYSVRQTVPSGDSFDAEFTGSLGGSATTSNVISAITITDSSQGTGYNFYDVPPPSISGYVRFDSTDDGQNNPAHPPLVGVTVELRDAAGNILQTTQTDVNGYYEFDCVTAGSYQVFQVVPSGYYFEDEFAGSAGGNTGAASLISAIGVSPGVNATGYNFYDVLPASLAGSVLLDANDDHQNNTGDPPLPLPVTVQLTNAAGNVVATTETNAAGQYAFDNLAPGSYGVAQVLPSGYFFNDAFAGSVGGSTAAADAIRSIALKGGISAVHYNFYDVLPASISGYVHNNVAGDCDNPTNPGVPGVTIELLGAQGAVVSTTVTDAQGYYQFTGLVAGTYAVEEILPAGWFDEASHVGSAGGTIIDTEEVGAIGLGAGVAGVNYDFCIGLPASISGVVYLDATANYVNATSDPPMSGVTVQLLNAQGTVIATAQTDSQGSYAFAGLRPGTYGVREVQPDGYFLEDSLPGTAGGTDESATLIDAVALNSGAAGANYDFWLLQGATLAGTVFQDGPAITLGTGQSLDLPAVRSGVLKAGDKLLAGVTLELRDGVTGAPILGSQALPGYYNPDQVITTVTDKDGNYSFQGLLSGTYAVYIQSPAGYITGIDKAGTTGGIVLDGYSAVAPQVLAQLVQQPSSGAILDIPLLPGDASAGNNFSVDQVLPEPKYIFVPPGPAPPPAPLAPMPVPQVAPAVAVQPPVTPPLSSLSPIYGSSTVMFTWHLSVVDGGQPRGASTDDPSIAMLVSLTPEQLADLAVDTDEGEWTLAGGNREGRQTAARRVLFGKRGAIPISGDFNGDGTHELGIFVDGHWYLDMNGNGLWDKGDLYAKLGRHGDKPVTGDWDGDGKTDIGIFGPAWRGDPRALRREPGLPDGHNQTSDVPKNVPPPAEQALPEQRTLKLQGARRARTDVIDHVFLYGTPQDVPVVGDWNGDGTSTVAVFRGGTWHFDSNGDGKWTKDDEVVKFGQRGDKPVAGDWNGDGTTDLGVYRDGTWHLDTNGNHILDAEDEVVQMGQASDTPVAGDWNGDGRHEPAIYHEAPADPVEPL